MRGVGWWLLGWTLLGCNEVGVTARNAVPTASITSHRSGDVVAALTPVRLAGIGSDPDDWSADLLATWHVDGVVACAEAPTDELGGTICEVELSAREHTITLTVSDGRGASGTEIRLSAIADELPPSAPVVALSPLAPRTTDTLQATVDTPAVDPEGAQVTYRYEWLRNGLDAGLSEPVVDADRTSAGDTWTVRVVPSDGALEGPAGTAEVVVLNTPPLLMGLSITPDPATTVEPLTCTATTDDDDGDAVQVDLEWTVDGTPAATTATLSASAFARDQQVACTATPHDGTESGPALTVSLTIDNSAPTAPTVEVAPTSPDLDDDLRCFVTVEADDDDGDPLVHEVSWSVDGTPYTGPTLTTVLPGDTVPGAVTALGEAWTCSVVAWDGTDVGAPGTASTAIDCTPLTWFPDVDGDSFGDRDAAVVACNPPQTDWIGVGGDCDDGDAAVNPTATEWCDTIDNDCDNTVDEPQAADAAPWYLDDDGDGFGDPLVSVPGCDQPAGYVADDTDCDDADGAVHPWAGDAAGDGVDGDCDGLDCEADVSGGTYLSVCIGAGTWHEARLECLLAGYDDLASIRDAAEQAFAEQLLADAGGTTTHSPWIGYADEVVEGLWGWSDLSTSTYTNWAPGEPNGGPAESCAELNYPQGAGQWNDADCYAGLDPRRSWICERR